MTVTSKVSMCNSALIKLGTATITSLSDGTKNGRLCNQRYDALRDELLRKHAWNFAIVQAEFARLVETPEFDLTYYYQIPADCIRILSLSDPDIKYRLEGGKIACDESTLKGRYIKREEDPIKYDALFIESFAWRMAWDLALVVTNNRNVQKNCKESFEMSIMDAEYANSIEDGQIEVESSTWLESRN